MRDGPAAGLALIEPMLRAASSPHTTWPTPPMPNLSRRAGHREAARTSFLRALALAQQEPERRLLRKRLAEIGG